MKKSKKYPYKPGWKDGDVSREVAESIEPFVEQIRNQIMALFDVHPGGLSNEQVADILGMYRTSTQPRMSELFRMKRVVKAGRTTNRQGNRCYIWKKAT